MDPCDANFPFCSEKAIDYELDSEKQNIYRSENILSNIKVNHFSPFP